MLAEYLQIARKSLAAHKLRSTLTVTSVMVGAFSIVLMSSLAKSGFASLAKSVEELGGMRIVMLTAKMPERPEDKVHGRYQGISKNDRRLIEGHLPHVESMTAFATCGRRDVTSDLGTVVRADFVGGDAGFFQTFAIPLGKGRFFNEDDLKRNARVCVVGNKVAQALWNGEAVGKSLSVGKLRCQVIGQVSTFARFGMNMGFEWDNFVAAPLETVAESEVEARDWVRIFLKTTHVQHNDLVKRIANVFLEQSHRGVPDFQIWDFSKVLDQFYGFFAVLRAIVGLIAGISLLVGGIGIMNMMLVSVSERVREIGIRKALGASPRRISGQFLSEAALLTTLGGVAGVLLGLILTVMANAAIGKAQPSWVGEISTIAVVLALAVSSGVGVVFGFFPARRAGRLDPVVAMRR